MYHLKYILDLIEIMVCLPILLFLAVVINVSCAPTDFADSPSYTVGILVDGTLLHQRIIDLNELQIIEVPAHNAYAQITAVLDFRNELELIKIIAEQRCQLSKLIPDVQHQRGHPTTRQTEPLQAANIERNHRPKLVNHDPIKNTSFLREELQEACRGLPIHWADDAPDGTNLNAVVTIDQQQYVMGTEVAEARSWSCAHETGPLSTVVNGLQLDLCHPSCQYQLCFPTSTEISYYLRKCGPASSPYFEQCYTFVSTPGNYCRMCCSDSRYSCSSKLFRCSCSLGFNFG